MTKFKRITVVGAVVLVIGAMSVTAFAASYSTPAEAVAGLTGKSVESVIEERAGKTYGAIADEAGKLAEFKTEMLEIRKDALNKRVAEGTMTQERADAIITAMEEHQATCDGAGTERTGQAMGARFGRGTGQRGAGQGMGVGQRGAGRGMGSCTGVGQTT